MIEYWDIISIVLVAVGIWAFGEAKVHAARQLLETVKSALEDKKVTPEEWEAIERDISLFLKAVASPGDKRGM